MPLCQKSRLLVTAQLALQVAVRCGRFTKCLWPISCGRYRPVADIDFACGRYGLLSRPIWFVVDIDVPVIHYWSFRRRVFAVSHLHWYWQTRTTKKQNTYKTQTNTTTGADFLGALDANAPREKLQWVRCTQKNLDLKLNFNGIFYLVDKINACFASPARTQIHVIHK